MSRLKGKQTRKYKRSCNRYYKQLGKKKKAGTLKPRRKKSILDYILS